MNDVYQFLENSLKELLNNPNKPTKIGVAYIDSEGVTVSYFQCNFEDLQRIGQTYLNEGTMRLVALNPDRIEQIQAEAEFDDSDDA